MKRLSYPVGLILSGLALSACCVFIFECAGARDPVDNSLYKFSAVGEVRPMVGSTLLFGDSQDPLANMRPFLLERDATLADFAGALAIDCVPAYRPDPITWDPDWLSSLSSSNVRVLNLADDHALDCGQESLASSLNYFMSEGFNVVGAGLDAEQARSPIYLYRGPVKVSIMSVTLDRPPEEVVQAGKAAPSFYERQSMINGLQEMKKKATYRIVVFHWPERDYPEMSEDELALVREAVNFGADLVLGHGPRSAGGLMRIRGTWVVLGMGAFTGEPIKDQPNKAADGLALSAEFTAGRMMNLRLSAVEVLEGKPSMVRGERGASILSGMVAGSDTEVSDNATLIGDILYLK